MDKLERNRQSYERYPMNGKRILMSLILIAAGCLCCAGPANGASAAMEQTPDHNAIVPNRAPLESTPFIRLPLGSVKPEGWLKTQLDLQKAGLIGSAEEIYDALTPDSGWLGGKGENWEKGPYYVRGLVALAYTLGDKQLEHRAQKWVDWVLQSQQPDGSFGPKSSNDWWPRMVVLFYIRDYYEATGDSRVIPFLTNYFHYQLKALPNRPLQDWGKSRAGDNIAAVLWTYNRTGDASLLKLAKLLHMQAYPWSQIYTDDSFYDFGADFQPQHNVNVNEALKFPPLAWLFTHNKFDHDAFQIGMANIDRRAGRIDGQDSGSEMITNRSSTAGVEFCCDVERILSDGIAINILGDPKIADQMEKVAYNSVPAHTSALMRQMTYYQLPNEVTCTLGGHGFTQDYDNGTVPGPHSGYPCCCYNWNTAWPEFVRQLWSATSDGGLAAIAYGPSRVTTTVAQNVLITITEKTDYPFKDAIEFSINPQHAATFPIVLRIPSWTEHPNISVNGKPESNLTPGTFHRIDRTWNPGDKIELIFPMPIRTSKWINNSIGITRGPIAFSLKIKEDWIKLHEYPGNCDEYQILPKSHWNYALDVDRNRPNLKVEEHDISSVPYDPNSPPVTITAKAQLLPSWGLKTRPGKVLLGRADGAWHPITSAPISLDPNAPHHLRVIAAGNDFKIYVDNMTTPVIDQRDATYAAGSVGLRAYSDSARFSRMRLNGHLILDTGHQLDPAAWESFGGDWSIQNNDYTTKATKDAKLLLKSPQELRDFTYETTVTIQPGGDAGLIFRVTDPTDKQDGYHGYYVGLASEKAYSQDAAEPPTSPVATNSATQTVELIPYGSAKLRISYFPVSREK